MRSLLPHATHILCHESAIILDMKFYGLPWTKEKKANLSSIFRSSKSSGIENIPSGTDVLVSSSPGYGKLDVNYCGDHCGNKELSDAIKAVRPLLHLHGGVHEARGFMNRKGNEPMVVNSCLVDFQKVYILFTLVSVRYMLQFKIIFFFLNPPPNFSYIPYLSWRFTRHRMLLKAISCLSKNFKLRFGNLP